MARSEVTRPALLACQTWSVKLNSSFLNLQNLPSSFSFQFHLLLSNCSHRHESPFSKEKTSLPRQSHCLSIRTIIYTPRAANVIFMAIHSPPAFAIVICAVFAFVFTSLAAIFFFCSCCSLHHCKDEESTSANNAQQKFIPASKREASYNIGAHIPFISHNGCESSYNLNPHQTSDIPSIREP